MSAHGGRGVQRGDAAGSATLRVGAGLVTGRARPADRRRKMSRSLGIPVKLLHEAAGHVVTVELKTGEVYRGSMVECEDNWNCQLENITFTAKPGVETHQCRRSTNLDVLPGFYAGDTHGTLGLNGTLFNTTVKPGDDVWAFS
ncbi:hypothetical protein EJB05_47562, partial [Eragrostis curvula]